MYNPEEAKKSFPLLFKQNGTAAIFKSMALVIFWYATDSYIFGVTPAITALAIVLFICAVYFTWKPKLIRFLRGHLRGREYRDRTD